jgi:hypothetical protein
LASSSLDVNAALLAFKTLCTSVSLIPGHDQSRDFSPVLAHVSGTMNDSTRAAWAGEVNIKYARAGRWCVSFRSIPEYRNGVAMRLKSLEVRHKLGRESRGAKESTCSISSVGSFCSTEDDMMVTPGMRYSRKRFAQKE